MIFSIALTFSLLLGAVQDAPSVHVLCYHAFLDKKDPFSFSIGKLKEQIRYCRENGYKFVTLSDVLAGKVTGNKNILVTIDDGNASTLDAYRQVFKPNKIRPVLGIYPNIINKKHYALTWKQLKYLSDDGCDIAAHGYYHLYVAKKLYKKDKKSFFKEIVDSKKVLEEKLGRKITVFIYPFGVYSEETIAALKQNGYVAAFTINNGGMHVPPKKYHNPFELPRYMLTKPSWKGSLQCINQNMMYKKGSKAAKGSSPKKIAKKNGHKVVILDVIGDNQNDLLEARYKSGLTAAGIQDEEVQAAPGDDADRVIELSPVKPAPREEQKKRTSDKEKKRLAASEQKRPAAAREQSKRNALREQKMRADELDRKRMAALKDRKKPAIEKETMKPAPILAARAAVQDARPLKKKSAEKIVIPVDKKKAQEKALSAKKDRREKKKTDGSVKQEYYSLTGDSLDAYNKFFNVFSGRVREYGKKASGTLRKNFTD